MTKTKLQIRLAEIQSARDLVNDLHASGISVFDAIALANADLLADPVLSANGFARLSSGLLVPNHGRTSENVQG